MYTLLTGKDVRQLKFLQINYDDERRFDLLVAAADPSCKSARRQTKISETPPQMKVSA